MKSLFTKPRCATYALLFTLFAYAEKGMACVDPDTIITVTTNYSPDFTEIEIRIGNIKLHTGSPNIFCSCALSDYANVFNNPNYIAFVLAGTNTPFTNFDNWDNTAEATNAWSNEFPQYPNWSGYIAEVINQGLSTTDDVEMVIRASTPPGTYAIVEELDSAMASLTLGTDMWLPDQQTMAFDHPGIRHLRFDNSSFTMNEKPASYFVDLDNALLSSAKYVEHPTFLVSFGPNPTNGLLNVGLDLQTAQILKLRILDINGQVAANIVDDHQSSGRQNLQLDLSAILPKKGLYLLEIQIGEEKAAQRFLRL